MTQLKIVSNPYERSIRFLSFDETSGAWLDISNSNPNSALREDASQKCFLPFKVREIINIIIREYYTGDESVLLFFEGTQDEYNEVRSVCDEEDFCNKIELRKSESILENARDILPSIKRCFNDVRPVIKNVFQREKDRSKSVNNNLAKITDALDDIIPICVFGNYSAGKSTFINALIGSDVLTCGSTVVTAKVYRIERSAQADRARIRFELSGQETEIVFENTCLMVSRGENALTEAIQAAVLEAEISDVESGVKIALELINGYCKKNSSENTVGNIISLEVPFSPNGLLGTSQNKYVIFDTPGSNSSTNMEHSKILSEALQGFSNGIPVWISTYDNLDTTDNAELCEKILNIDALDKRFTMIVCNRADQADLEGEGLSDEQVSEIMEYNAVEKMYASGIYFVSSIMGLGAKKGGKLSDKFCRRIFRQQQDAYADPEDEDYIELYKFDILPGQLKAQSIAAAAECGNLIYVNSGLYSIERDIETFASRYAAYNKCQMVYLFLDRTVAETSEQITKRTAHLQNMRNKRVVELDADKQKLIATLEAERESKLRSFKANAAELVKTITGESSTKRYLIDSEQIRKLAQDIRSEEKAKTGSSQGQGDLYTQSDDSNDAKSHDGLSVSIPAFLSKLKEQKAQSDRIEKAERELDRKTSDRVIDTVIEEYKQAVDTAQHAIGNNLKQQWRDNAAQLRKQMIAVVTESDALTPTQQKEIEDVIINYQDPDFLIVDDKLFVTDKFLNNNFPWFNINDSQKLNVDRLRNAYNDKINKAIKEIANRINKSCNEAFSVWVDRLESLIKRNIEEYNPRLRAMAEMIQEETDHITKLQGYQQVIAQSLEVIKSLIMWKMPE